MDQHHSWRNNAWHRPRCLAAGMTLTLSLAFPFPQAGAGAGPPAAAEGSARSPIAKFPALAALDLSGRSVDPFDAHDAPATVFLFVSTECPISNRYAPEVRRLQKKFARFNVRFWLVYSDPQTSVEAIREHLKAYQLPVDVLRDSKHALVRLSQARTTPEAAVFLPGGRLAYHGRIDDRFVALGKERPEATRHDLEMVLEAIAHGKPAPFASTPSVGCYIPDLK
ncbi:MAG: redoxin domain-containing protein [Verrucomicrobia bacterium]|nr:redoxin domain-containing protein [Verrucomicrobiota bacterium]